jgi:GNAT superfamily N-acetyltransferase
VFKLELLSRDHDRDSFDSGSSPLDDFLRRTARQHADRGLSRTFVLVEESSVPPKPILGFFSLTICQLKSEGLSPAQSRRLPRDVSGVRLARLAVAKERQQQGIGKLLLVGAMQKVMQIFHNAGGIGLFVDAKDDSARVYYEQFGFVPLPSNPLQLFLPLETMRQAVGTKREAASAKRRAGSGKRKARSAER